MPLVVEEEEEEAASNPRLALANPSAETLISENFPAVENMPVNGVVGGGPSSWYSGDAVRPPRSLLVVAVVVGEVVGAAVEPSPPALSSSIKAPPERFVRGVFNAAVAAVAVVVVVVEVVKALQAVNIVEAF